MHTTLLYLDDADYARSLLQSVVASGHTAQTHWVLVACAPRITHRVSKFVSNRTRENWRSKWADKLFASIVPMLADSGGRITTVLARVPLHEVQAQVQAEYGPAVQVVDLRRPKQQAASSQVGAAPLSLRKIGASLASLLVVTNVLMQEMLVA